MSDIGSVSSSREDIIPFGEFVCMCMNAEEGTHLHALAACSATLYLFRQDPDLLRDVIHSWYCHMGAVWGIDEGPFQEHIMNILQNCVENYFSINWHRMEEVAQCNEEYRANLHCDDALVLEAEAAGHRGTERSAAAPRSRISFGVPDGLTVFYDSTVDTVSHDGAVIMFFALFSQESLKMLKTFVEAKEQFLEDLEDADGNDPSVQCLRKMQWGVVNCATEPRLFEKYAVKAFPTLLLLKCDTCTRFPSNGKIAPYVIANWVKSGGKTDVRRVARSRATTLRTIRPEKHFAKNSLPTAPCDLLDMHRSFCHSREAAKALCPVAEPPVFIFLGGGMAAGKTTAVSAVAGSEWWKRKGHDVVIISADDIKAENPLHALNTQAQHWKSVEEAERRLVKAVNEGRDIVFDGTMAWLPFVSQTITMIRNATTHLHRRGPGYDTSGANPEVYWQREDTPRCTPLPVPYHIRLIGVTVDVRVAVQRGIIRRLITGRGVPVANQLRSFQRFAKNFTRYADLCDEVVLYNTNVRIDIEKETPPVIAEKRPGGATLHIIDAAAYGEFQLQMELDPDAKHESELFPTMTPKSSFGSRLFSEGDYGGGGSTSPVPGDSGPSPGYSNLAGNLLSAGDKRAATPRSPTPSIPSAFAPPPALTLSQSRDAKANGKPTSQGQGATTSPQSSDSTSRVQ